MSPSLTFCASFQPFAMKAVDRSVNISQLFAELCLVWALSILTSCITNVPETSPFFSPQSRYVSEIFINLLAVRKEVRLSSCRFVLIFFDFKTIIWGIATSITSPAQNLFLRYTETTEFLGSYSAFFGDRQKDKKKNENSVEHIKLSDI